MNNPSRRRFLATTGAGAAAVGAAAIVPTVLAGNSHKAQPTAPVAGSAAGAGAGAAKAAPQAAVPQVPADASGSLLVWVANVRDDTVTLMVGEQDVVVHDSDLVARLASAAF